MDRAFLSGASATPPTAPVSPSVGYTQPGNPGGGVPATKPGPWWYHMITEELRAVIVAAGLTPNQVDTSQLLQALPAALASRPEMSRSLSPAGYQKLPGGLIFQWGGGVPSAAGNLQAALPIAFPNSQLRALVSTAGESNPGLVVSVFSLSTTSYDFRVRTLAGAASTQQLNWMALGY